MRSHLAWITRKKLFLAPLVLLVLLLAIAACGSDSETTQPQNAVEAERMEAEAMAMEEEKMEAEAMAMKEAEAMAMKEAEAMAMKEAEAMAMKEAEAMAMKDGPALKLDLSGVEPLANGYHYEGWAIIDGGPVSTGKFNIGANGGLVKLDGTVKTGGVFHSVPGLD